MKFLLPFIKPRLFSLLFTTVGVCLPFLRVQAQTQEQVPDTINLLYNWHDPSLPATLAYANVYNDVWGMAINGREYAILGSTMGTHIFDITTAGTEQEVAFIEGAYTGNGVIHRDYADYRGFLYIVCDEGYGISTLQIVDMRTLPEAPVVVYDSNELLTMAHTVVIDTLHARLYACAPTNINGTRKSLQLFDIHEPANPQFLKNVFLPDWVHDCYVQNDTAYLNTSDAGLYILYFGDPQNPITLGSLTDYPGAGYNHSCWITTDGDYLVFADENHGEPLKIADISDFSDIEVVATCQSGIAPNSIAHNPVIKGNYLYASYYHDGLQIFDLTDPLNPQKISEYKTYLPTDHDSYRGAWGVYPFLPSGKVLVADMQYGLFVFDVGMSPANPPTSTPPTPLPTNGQNTSNIHYRIDQNSLHISTIRQENLIAAQLYDLTGQLVWQQNNIAQQATNALNIPLSELKTKQSLLVVRLQTNSGTYTQKISLF